VNQTVKRFYLMAIALSSIVFSQASAQPIVNGTTLEFTQSGWYQVQRRDDFSTVCEGPDLCEVEPGTYIVINHTTGERFENVQVAGATPVMAANGITTANGTIFFPNNDWYQVQNATDLTSVCEGFTPCEAGEGTYIIINFATGERLENFFVGESASSGADPLTDSPELTSPSAVSVSGNTISWPDDGWYQVQSASTFESICEGGTSCEVAAGTYQVINHSSGQRFENIVVGDSERTGDEMMSSSELTDTSSDLSSTLNSSSALQLLQVLDQISNDNSPFSVFENSDVGQWVTEEQGVPAGFSQISVVDTSEAGIASSSETVQTCSASGTVDSSFFLPSFGRTLQTSFDFNDCSDGQFIFNGEITRTIFSSFSGRTIDYSFTAFSMDSALSGELLGSWTGNASAGQPGTLDDRITSYELSVAEFSTAAGVVSLENLERFATRRLDIWDAARDGTEDGIFVAQSLETGVYYFASQQRSDLGLLLSFNITADFLGDTAVDVAIDNRALIGALKSEDLPAGQSLPVDIRLSPRCPADVDRCEAENTWSQLALSTGTPGMLDWESTRLRAVAVDGSELLVEGGFGDEGLFSQSASITTSSGTEAVLPAVEQPVRPSQNNLPWSVISNTPGLIFDLRAVK